MCMFAFVRRLCVLSACVLMGDKALYFVFQLISFDCFALGISLLHSLGERSTNVPITLSTYLPVYTFGVRVFFLLPFHIGTESGMICRFREHSVHCYCFGACSRVNVCVRV